MSYLLDTNVISEFGKRSPHAGVMAWFRMTPPQELHLSALTLGEIRNGVERLRGKDGPAAVRLDTWLRSVRRDYAARIVDVDAAIGERWGELNARYRLPIIDGLLAATALVHDWTLVTRNLGDVERTGVRIHDPFTE